MSVKLNKMTFCIYAKLQKKLLSQNPNPYTALKMKCSITDFFSKCDQNAQFLADFF